MTSRNLSELDRDICQPLGRILQEAFEDGIIGKVTITNTAAEGKLIGVDSKVTMSTDVAGNMAGVFGRTYLSATTGTSAKNAFGGCFELKYESNYAATGMGLATGLYAGVYSDQAGQVPNSCFVVEAIPGANVDFSNMPLMVLMNSGEGTAPNIAIEFGHHPAGKTVSCEKSGDMYWNETIRVKVNNEDRYIPLSTVQSSFTTEYPIVSTYVSGELFKVGAEGTHLISAVAAGQLHLFVDNSTASGTNRVLRVETLSTGELNTLENFAIRGTAGIKTGVTGASGNWCIGVQGKVVSAGTHPSGSTSAAVLAQLNNSGTFNAGATLYGAWIDCQLATTPSNGGAGGNFWMLGITTAQTGLCQATAMIYAFGGAIAAFDFTTFGDPVWCASSGTLSTAAGYIKCTINGATRYIPTYSAIA